jgi:hypothetical protein
MTRFVLVLSTLLVACDDEGVPVPPLDAAFDPGPRPDAGPGIDAGPCGPGSTADGCRCSEEEEGRYVCGGASNSQCCGGVWRSFFDGPCWELGDAGVLDGSTGDAGAPDCSKPHIGCPCTIAEDTLCRSFQPRLVCREGSWRSDGDTGSGYACCGG